MEKIGRGVMSLAPLLERKKEEVTEWKQTRVMREERQKCARPTPRCAPSASR